LPKVNVRSADEVSLMAAVFSGHRRQTAFTIALRSVVSMSAGRPVAAVAM
jgi:hypothetical protein